MKKWPKDNSVTVDMSDLIDPVKAAFKRVIDTGDGQYTGYETPSFNHNCFTPEETFSESRISKEPSQNRDELDAALGVAFRLGYEQAKREFCEEKKRIQLLTSLLDSMEK